MNVAETLAHWLPDAGITHAFGIVGGGNVALWSAIARTGKTALISVHHEQAAAMAATYFYRASGRLALCLVTTGAGSANAITGVLAAWMDSIPLIVISGNEPSRFLGEHPLPRVCGTQGYDSVEVARGFTKMAYRFSNRSDYRIIKVLETARKVALSGNDGGPGPVWIDIPKDVQAWQA